MYRKPFCLPNMRVSCKCSFHPFRGLHCGLFTSQLENRHRSMQTDNRCKAPVVKLVGDHGRKPFATFATIALLPVAHLPSPSSIPPWSKLLWKTQWLSFSVSVCLTLRPFHGGVMETPPGVFRCFGALQ